MMDETSKSEQRNLRRRTLRCSLRFLFIVMTIISIYLGMLTVRARHQRAAVSMVRDLRGSVQFAYQRLTNLEDWLGLADTRVTDDGLHHLRSLEKLHNLNLRRTKATKAGADSLGEYLPNTFISIGP